MDRQFPYTQTALNKIFGTKEESAATEEVVEEVDFEINVGDKVRILENNVHAPVGVVGTIVSIEDSGELKIEDGKNKFAIWLLPDKKYVEKVNEREDN